MKQWKEEPLKDDRRLARTWLALLGCVLIALILRLSLLYALHDSYFYSRVAVRYGEVARHLAAGQGYVRNGKFTRMLAQRQSTENRLIDIEEVGPPTQPDELIPELHQLPGYSFLLAVTYLISGDQRYIYLQIIQAFADAILGVLLMFWISKAVFGRRLGLISAFLYAMWAPLARISIAPLPDAWMSIFILTSLALVLKGTIAERARWYALAGLVIGVSAYFRPDVASIIFLYGLAIAVSKRSIRSGIEISLLMLSIWFVVLLPYGLRNYTVFGHFVIMRPAVGIILWEGIGEYPNRWGIVCKDEEARKLMEQCGYQWGSVEGNRLLIRKSVECIREDPLWYTRSVLRRAPRTLFWLRNDWGLPSILRKPTYHEFVELTGEGLAEYFRRYPAQALWRVIRRLLAVVEAALFFVAIAGLWITRRKWQLTLILMPVPLSRIIPFLFIHVEGRWILIGTMPYLILAAVVLDKLCMRRSLLVNAHA